MRLRFASKALGRSAELARFISWSRLDSIDMLQTSRLPPDWKSFANYSTKKTSRSRARSLANRFTSVGSSLQPRVSSTDGIDYVDVREDRAVFFGTASGSVLEINYQIKSSNRGEFVVPPVFAESMYERHIKGLGVGGKITVTE